LGGLGSGIDLWVRASKLAWLEGGAAASLRVVNGRPGSARFGHWAALSLGRSYVV